MALNPPEFSEVEYPDVITHREDSSFELYLSLELDLNDSWLAQVLEMLMLSGQKAAFVVRGEQVEEASEWIQRIQMDGHEIINGFYGDMITTNLSASEIRDGIHRTDELLADITGLSPVFFRPKNGEFDARLLEVLNRTGHEMILWNVMPTDQVYLHSQEVVQLLLEHSEPGSIFRLRQNNAHLQLKEFFGDFIMATVQSGKRFAPFRDLLSRG